MNNIQANIRVRETVAQIMALCDGEAAAFAESANGQRFWEAIHAAMLERLPRREPPQEKQPMTDAQAAMFERAVMPFGVHQGQPIARVPLEYLDWLIGQTDDFKTQVRRYLANKRVSSLVVTETED